MTSWSANDRHFMQLAIEQAVLAADADEVPVGAIVVSNGEITGQGHNTPLTTCDPTAHAEIVALRRAALHEKNYRLSAACLYVTLEPCAMCVGAMLHARIRRLVFGAYDDKAGAAGSVLDLASHRSMNHRIEVNGGLLQDECASLLQRFFACRR
jgi:tRNA(adenine34) deaminase